MDGKWEGQCEEGAGVQETDGLLQQLIHRPRTGGNHPCPGPTQQGLT